MHKHIQYWNSFPWHWKFLFLFSAKFNPQISTLFLIRAKHSASLRRKETFGPQMKHKRASTTNLVGTPSTLKGNVGLADSCLDSSLILMVLMLYNSILQFFNIKKIVMKHTCGHIYLENSLGPCWGDTWSRVAWVLGAALILPPLSVYRLPWASPCRLSHIFSPFFFFFAPLQPFSFLSSALATSK